MARRSAGLLVYRRGRGPVRRDVGAAGAAPDVAAHGAPESHPGAPERHAGAAAEPLEVLVVHPGGPYWSKRDDGWWSIPKGEVEDGEDDLAAAEREFCEELGLAVPEGPRTPLGEIVQAGGKRVRAWAVAGDLDVSDLRGGTFELEWPPRSGARRRYPEVDRAAWCTLAEARTKLLGGQVPLLERLERALGLRGDRPGGTE